MKYSYGGTSSQVIMIKFASAIDVATMSLNWLLSPAISWSSTPAVVMLYSEISAIYRLLAVLSSTQSIQRLVTDLLPLSPVLVLTA